MKRITVGAVNDGINVFYVKDREAWVRGGGPGPEYKDCSLYDFIRRIAKVYGVNVEPDNEELDWQMCDMLADGVETKEGLIAFFYTAAVQAAGMRERLREVEEALCVGGNEFDLERLRKMIQSGSEPIKRGKWIKKENPNGDPYYTCSFCNYDWVFGSGTPIENGFERCPHCGALMEV